jgi:DNA-binding phage protein
MKLYESRDWLYRRYVVQKKSVTEIAKEAGCSHMTIQRALEKFGLIKNQRKWK